MGILTTLATVALCLSTTLAGNPRPIVGILTLPNTKGSAFPASYVKWLESGGVRVVPIDYRSDITTVIKPLLKQINGALFTGGSAGLVNKDASLTAYALAAQAIFEESVAAAAAGETWPLWGTCLGHELIGVLGAFPFSSTPLSTGFDSENLTSTVQWTPAANSSRLWGASTQVRELLATQPLATNAHQAGITLETFAASRSLSANFVVTSTGEDRAGKVFIASMEHKTAPIFTTQWHSEKVEYEWPEPQDEAIARGADAVLVNSFPAPFFGALAASNDRSFADLNEEWASLIYNYPATVTYNTGNFMQQYYFATPPAPLSSIVSVSNKGGKKQGLKGGAENM